MKSIIHLLGFIAAPLALAGLAAPAQAQFGGLGRIINDARNAAENDEEEEEEQTPEECEQDSSPSVGRAVLGGILGRASRDAANRAGIGSFVPVSEFSDQLTTAIACRLDPDEQRQAADATLEATRGTSEDGSAEVGASAAWTSETREGVSGRSTVTGRQAEPGDGLDCIFVTDVIIVEGEETRADKRMCRQPPSPRYSIRA
jgi:hypothetical protein